MTRLEQALRWWDRDTEPEIPPRHFATLVHADYIADELVEGFYYDLNDEGRAALVRLERESTKAGP